MKKFRCFVLNIIMLMFVVGLTGCEDKKSNSDSAIDKEETSSVSSSTEVEDEVLALQKADFIQMISQLVDTSKYEVKDWSLEEGYGNSIEYSIKYKEAYDFDYTIEFSGNTSIKLPTTYSEMSNLLWKTEVETDKQISNKVQTGVYYTNSVGDKVTLWTQNLVGGDETYAKLSDCKFFAIDFKAQEVSQYIICGRINENSTLSDIVKVLGNPSNIKFNMDTNEIMLCFFEDISEGQSNINIQLNGEGNSIISIKYQYSYSDL